MLLFWCEQCHDLWNGHDAEPKKRAERVQGDVCKVCEDEGYLVSLGNDFIHLSCAIYFHNFRLLYCCDLGKKCEKVLEDLDVDYGDFDSIRQRRLPPAMQVSLEKLEIARDIIEARFLFHGNEDTTSGFLIGCDLDDIQSNNVST